MKDRLCVSERRIRILDYISLHKKVTIRELTEIFCVSKNTIVRDIEFISSIAPIYTNQGNGGGVYILPEYRRRSYLTDKEEELLYSLINKVSPGVGRVLYGIIVKFTKNPLRKYDSFQNLKKDKEEEDEGSIHGQQDIHL